MASNNGSPEERKCCHLKTKLCRGRGGDELQRDVLGVWHRLRRPRRLHLALRLQGHRLLLAGHRDQKLPGRERLGLPRAAHDRRGQWATIRVVEITYNVILDQDQVQAIYFDLGSDQIIFVIFLPYEKVKIKIR